MTASMPTAIQSAHHALNRLRRKQHARKLMREDGARSREYMARMQGNAAPANPLLAAQASEPIAAGKSMPAPDLAEAPMRAGVN